MKGEGHQEKREPGEQLTEVLLGWQLQFTRASKSQFQPCFALFSHTVELENGNTSFPSFPCSYALPIASQRE